MGLPNTAAPFALLALLAFSSSGSASPGESRESADAPAQIAIDDTVDVTVHLAGFGERATAISPSVVTEYKRSANGTDENGTRYGYPVTLKLRLTWDELPGPSFGRIADFVNASAKQKTVEGRLNYSQVVKMRDQKLRLDAFDPLAGYEIEKDSLASFLGKENPPREGDAIDIFLLNLSYLGQRPGAPEHWIHDPVFDLDSGREMDWFRLEWDNAMNIPVAFPSEAGVSGRRLMVDPSAHVWYLDWTNIWWQKGNGSAPYGTRYDDVPPAQRPGYLADLINEYVDGLLTVLPRAPLHRKAEVATFLLDDSKRFTADELRWTASQPKVMDYLRGFAPYLQWSDTLAATNVSAYPGFEKAVRENTTTDPNTGYKRIDGNKVHDYIAKHKSEFITMKKDTLTLITVSLFFENGAMFTQGNEFTGLGGGGVSSIYMNTSRLFYPDTPDRKMGISSVIVHETGHDLGYPHLSYRTDLVADVMGYYHDPYEFSVFWEGSYHKVRIRILAEQLNQRLGGVNDPRVDDLIGVFYSDYAGLRYVEAYYDLLALEALLDSKYLVYGFVTDPAGAALANASVKVENRATSTALIAKADRRGLYIVDLGAAPGGVKAGDKLRATSVLGARTSFREMPADSTRGLRIDLAAWYSLPPAPTAVQASPGDRSATVRWTQSTGGGLVVSENTVYRGPSPGALAKIRSMPATTSYVDPGLANDATYYYAISATNELGEGNLSAAAPVFLPVTDSDIPGAVTGLTATAGASWVKLEWSAPAKPGDSGIARYVVHRRVEGFPPTEVGETKGAETTFNDSGIAPGIYHYTVRTVNLNGRAGPDSTEASAEVQSPSLPPGGNGPAGGFPVLPLAAAVAIVALLVAAAAVAVRKRRRALDPAPPIREPGR